ncbi:GyrI-like domain-containing protein [Clostridium sp. LBM24168]
MDLNEIVKSAGLTKKAADYYGNDIIKMFKKYLEDVEDNVSGLKEINEILEKCKKIVYSIQPDIKAAAESMQILTKAFNIYERQKAGCIKKELHRIFPGFFGEYIYLNFSEYFMEPLDTKEKENSWGNIIKILDRVEYPDKIEKIEELIKENSIDWAVVEKFIENSKRRIGSKSNVSIYEYPNILNNFRVTKNDVDFCDELFIYMSSKNQIDYVKSLFDLIDEDLKILSKIYRNVQNNTDVIMDSGDPNEIEIGKGILNIPEITFAVYEYRKFLPFGNMDSLIYRFKTRIKEIEDVINPNNIYVIKGIDSISEYKKSKMNIFEFGFSFLVGVRTSSTAHIPEDIKKIIIPAHKYAWYTSSGGRNMKDLIMEDLSTINFLDNKCKLSNFPMIQLYNEEYLGKKDGRLIFNSYIPIE